MSDKKYWLDKDGYQIKNIMGKKFRVHRLVMEQFLGRKLLITEVIHHKNHNKQDNRIENLEVIENTSEHLRKYHNKVWNKGKSQYVTKRCPICKKEFTRLKRLNRKYCGIKCSSKFGQIKALEKNIKYFGCFVEGCSNSHCAKGMCRKHYYKKYYTSGSYKRFLTSL